MYPFAIKFCCIFIVRENDSARWARPPPQRAARHGHGHGYGHPDDRIKI